MTLRIPSIDCGHKAIAIVSLLLAMAAPQAANSAERAFSAMAGSWSGGGTIKKSNGSAERIRCRSTDEPGSGGDLSLRLRCASDSFTFDLSANVRYDGGAISGSWSEASRNVGGNIQGRSNPNGSQVQAVAQSVAFTANLTINTRGARQSIVISSPGSEVSEVSVALEKR
jgi:hypothetical protein